MDAENACSEDEEDNHDEGEGSRNGGGGREVGAPYAMGEIESDARGRSPDGGADAAGDEHQTEPSPLTFVGRRAFLNSPSDPVPDEEPPAEVSDGMRAAFSPGDRTPSVHPGFIAR